MQLQKAKIPAGKILVGGNWREGTSEHELPLIYPGSGAVLASFHGASKADVDEAVRAARVAFDGPWTKKIRPAKRSQLLWKLSELMLANADELAELESLVTGKPIRETRGVEIPLSAEIFQYFAGWATKIHGETTPSLDGMLNFTLREPVGVVGMITPWNFPLLMSSWKLAAALACGNVVVHKPSELTPLTALRMGELALEAGFPEGVYQVLPGLGPETGEALVQHQGVDKISFTGSTAVGKHIMRESAASLKRLTLELGGKNPNVVFADADLDAAVKGALNAAFYNKGEVCAAGSRLLVERSVHGELVEQLAARAARFASGQGDPLSPDTRLGPQASEAHMNKILAYIEKGKAEGAKLVAGGSRNEEAGEGFFVKPTIFDDVKPEMAIAREEIFGPVVSVIPFDTVEEAMALGNDSDYGLVAGVWTRDMSKALRAAKALRAGTVWVNCFNIYDPAMPFGGFKASGFGRELGAKAIENYTETKSVMVAL